MKAIPTNYNGIKFRSKLEASWAQWLDEEKIKWSYETEGFDLDKGVWYLPDFYLPEINTIIEVKGVMEHIEKPFKLMEYLKEHTELGIMFLLGGPTGYFYDINPWYECGVWIHKCSKCGKKSIVSDLGDYSCRVCGHHDGGHHDSDILPILTKPLEWLELEIHSKI